MPPQPPGMADGPTPGIPAASKYSYAVDLGRRLSLHVRDGTLFIQEGRIKAIKKSRTCSFVPTAPAQFPNTTSIPLYNILWAHFDDKQLTLNIEYVQKVRKTCCRAAKLIFPVSYTTSPLPGDGDDGGPPASPPENIAGWIEHLLDMSYGPIPRQRRAYVIINPHAGPGGAANIWEKQVRPIFEAARMPLTVHQTTYSGEAAELAEKMDIDAFDIVVPCSGDGLPHEVFNGLGRRADAKRALQAIAVAHVPCGSGNALACNVFGTHRPSQAALAIVKGVATPIDLISITQGNGRMLSFLSQALGLIAEADLGTEHLRWMGEHRFTYGVITRILKKKVYPCDLWVKVEIDHKHGVREHYTRERENSAVLELDRMTTSALNRIQAGGETSSASSDNAAGSQDDAGLPPLKYGTIHEKLPDDWHKMDCDNLGNFYCGNVAYMAPDAIFFSAAWINDGLIDLITVDGNVPISQAPGLLLSVSNNSFFDHPLVTYRKVSAFRIVPKDQEDGYISIDGEKMPFTPFQAEVHQGLGMVITRRGVLEAPGPRNWDKITTTQRLMA